MGFHDINYYFCTPIFRGTSVLKNGNRPDSRLFNPNS